LTFDIKNQFIKEFPATTAISLLLWYEKLPLLTEKCDNIFSFSENLLSLSALRHALNLQIP